jgi:nucleotide-binding universal stress UspA family protein
MNQDILQKIKDLGIPEEQTEEFYELLSGQVLEQIFTDYADKATDEELKVMETRLQESKSTEHLQTILNEVALTVYGDENLAADTITQAYDDKLEEARIQIEETRNLLQRVQSGDPEATRAIEEAQQTEEYKSLMSE